jgi:type III secretory pathway lipoprotein EscJ
MAEDWEIVKIVSTEEEANIVVGFLESSGIEAEAESLAASEFPIDFGELAQVRIRVPAGQAQEAVALLNQREDLATGDEGEMAGEPLAGDGEGQGEP